MRARESEDSWAVGESLSALAHAAMVAGDYPRARRHTEEAGAWLSGAGNTYTLAQMFTLLGDISRLEGAYEEAREHYERALSVVEDIGWSGMLPSMRHNVVWARHGLGDDEGAIERFISAARDFQQMGDTRGVAECLVGLACAAREPGRAARLFSAGLALLGKNEMTLSYPNQREYDRTAVRRRAGLGEADWQTAWAEGARLTPDQALELVQ